MDTLFAILSVGILLAIFGVIAAIVGEDTRDGFGDDRAVFPRFAGRHDDWAVRIGRFALAKAGRELWASGPSRPAGHGSDGAASHRPRLGRDRRGRLVVFVIIGSRRTATCSRTALRAPRPRGPAVRTSSACVAAPSRSRIQRRARGDRGWSFEADDDYRLFELGIEHAARRARSRRLTRRIA
jgi:hypothetical protein